MSVLPLAHVSRVVAIQHRDSLYLSVTGHARGFDGTLELVRSPTRIYPPLFFVYERPGNCGITGECPPDHEATVARAFAGHFREIQVRTADSTLHPPVLQVRDPEPVDSASEAATLVEPAAADRQGPGWWAWENTMPGPGSQKSLHVLGLVMMPTPGYVLKLVKAQPQGFNPNVLILDLAITRPSGLVTQVLTLTRVEFEEASERLYSHVHIRPIGVTMPVEFAW
ncbi:MAG: hypothetical protein WC683_10485 [bacterium]